MRLRFKKRDLFWVILVTLLIYRFIDWYGSRREYRIGERVEIRGCLREESEIKKRGQSFELGGFKIYLSEGRRLETGDCVRVVGRFRVVEKEEGECREGCFVEGEEMEGTGESGWYKAVGKVRNKLLGVIKKSLPKREGDLVSGMVLGVRGGMDSEFLERLKRTGTLHIVVASGSNVALVAGAVVTGLSLLLGRKIALVVGLLMIWFYAFLAGFDSPVVRAGIMASVLFLGQVVGRKFSVGRALLVAVVGMVIFNPGVILEVSFQLSVMAMMGVVLAGKGKGVGQELRVGWWVFLMVWPILAVNFSELQWAGVGVNMVVMGVVGPITILGMVGSVLGLVPVVGEVVGRVIMWGVYPLAWYFSEVVSFLGSWEWLSMEVEVNWFMVVGYYLIVSWWIVGRKDREKEMV